MNIIAEIRSEIKRIEELYYPAALESQFEQGILHGLGMILSFLDTLQEPDIEDVKIEWWNKGYIEGRKNAHIPARELGLPKSMDFKQEPEVDLEEECTRFYRTDEYKTAQTYGRGFETIARHFYELGKNEK